MGAVSRQGSLLLMAFLIHTVLSAPVIEENTDLLGPDQTAEGNGCYYNYEHYEEGDRIVTNEPCLNCTCHNRMLMCYLRVCPFTKAIGQDCKIEKKPDQCCPVITCPQVPVALLTSSTTETTTATALGHPDQYGCVLDDNTFYPDGAQVPSDPRKPCELCYCIRNHTACVMQECTLNVEGCKPVYQEGVCCPVRYDCDYDNVPTTPKPTVGLITTPEGPAECNVNGKLYYDGELIDNMTTNPCEHCYCMRGEVVCAVQDCGTPLEHTECTPMPAEPGQCCPSTYQCPNGTVPAQALQTKPKPDEGSVSVTEKLEEEKVYESTGQPEASPEVTTQTSSSDFVSGGHTMDDHKEQESVGHEPNPEHDEASAELATGEQVDHTSEQPKEQAIIEIITTARPGDAQEITTVTSERLQEAEPKPEAIETNSEPDDSATSHDQEDHIEQDPSEDVHHEEHEEHDAEATTIPGHYTEISVENVEMNTSPPETSKPADRPVESEGTNVVEPSKVIPSGAHTLDEADKTVGAGVQEVVSTSEAPQETNEAPKDTQEASKGEDYPAGAGEVVETTPATTSTTSSPEPQELPRIPGEGSCLYKGITYAPNTEVPSADSCKRCKCVNSIIECGDVECPEPPISLYSNCVPMPPTDDTCCPTYFCEQKPSQEPEAENHLSIDKIDEGIADEELLPTTAAPTPDNEVKPSADNELVPEHIPTGAHVTGEDSVSQQSSDVPQGIELPHPVVDSAELEHQSVSGETIVHPDEAPHSSETPVEQVTAKSSGAQDTTRSPIEAETTSPVEVGQPELPEQSQGGESHVPVEEQAPTDPSFEESTTQQQLEHSASDFSSGGYDSSDASEENLSPHVELDHSANSADTVFEDNTPSSISGDLTQTTVAPSGEVVSDTQTPVGAAIQPEDIPQTTVINNDSSPTEKPSDAGNVASPSGNAVNRGDYAAEPESESSATEVLPENTHQQELEAASEGQQTPAHDVSSPEPGDVSIDGEVHMESTPVPLPEENRAPDASSAEAGAPDNQGSAYISTEFPNQQDTTIHPPSTNEHDSIPSGSSHPSEPEHIANFDSQGNSVDHYLPSGVGASAQAEPDFSTSSPVAPQKEGPSGVTEKPEEPAPFITTGPPVLFPDIGHQGAPIHVPGPEGVSQDTNLSGDRNLIEGERLGATESPAQETSSEAAPTPQVGVSEGPQANEEMSMTTEGAKQPEATGPENNDVAHNAQESDDSSLGDNQISDSSHTPDAYSHEDVNEIVPTGSESPSSTEGKAHEGVQEATTEAPQTITEKYAESSHNEEGPILSEGVHNEGQPAEGVHDETQPTEGAHNEIQPAEGAHDETQPAEGAHDETQPAEGAHDETQPTEGVHEETQPAEGAHDENQPAERIPDGTQTVEGVHDETQPAEGAHDETQPAEGAHDETQQAEGAHDETQPDEGAHDETQPTEGGHDGTQTAEGVHDETQPAEGVHDDSQPAEGAHGETQPAEGVPDGTQPVEGVHDGTHSAEGVHDDSQPAEGVHDETQPAEGVHDETQPAEGVHDETQPAEGAHDETQPAEGVHDGTQMVEGVLDGANPEQSTDESTIAQQATSEAENSVTETHNSPIVTHGDLPNQPYISGDIVEEEKQPEGTVSGQSSEESESATAVTESSPAFSQEISNEHANSEISLSEVSTLGPAHDEVITHIDSAGPQKVPEIANQVVEPNLNTIEHSSADEHSVGGDHNINELDQDHTGHDHEEVATEEPTAAITEEPKLAQSSPEEPSHQLPDESLLAGSEIQTHDHIAEHSGETVSEEHTSESVHKEPQPEDNGENVEQTTQKEDGTSDQQPNTIDQSANTVEENQAPAMHHDGEGSFHEDVHVGLTNGGETAEEASEHVPVGTTSVPSHGEETATNQHTQTPYPPESEPAVTSAPEEPSPHFDQAEENQATLENGPAHEQYEGPTAAPEHQEEQTSTPDHHDEQLSTLESHGVQPSTPEQHEEQPSSPENNHGEQPSIPEHHEGELSPTEESPNENAQVGSRLPEGEETEATETAQTNAPYQEGAHNLGVEIEQSSKPIEEVHFDGVTMKPEHLGESNQAEGETSPSETGSTPATPDSSSDHASNPEDTNTGFEGFGPVQPSMPVNAPEGVMIDGSSAPSASETGPSAAESTQEQPEGEVHTVPEDPSAPAIVPATLPETAPEDPSGPGSVSAVGSETAPDDLSGPESAVDPDTAPASGFASGPDTALEHQPPNSDNLESPSSTGSEAAQPDQSSHLPEEIEKVPESSSSPLSQLSSSPSPPVELPSTEGPALPPSLQNWSQKPYHPQTEHPVHPEPPQMPEDSHYPSPPFDQDYEDEDSISYGPGTCRYGGKVYLSAQQIPRDDPCDFCFCFRSDIICLQQSCPPPIKGCYQETIKGFCCPRYECHVSMATMVNITTTSTTTTTTVPPHFLSHHYSGAARKAGCQVKGVAYAVGDSIPSTSGPCLDCRCGADGQMKCDPTNCGPQESLLRQVMAASVTKRRRR